MKVCGHRAWPSRRQGDFPGLWVRSPSFRILGQRRYWKEEGLRPFLEGTLDEHQELGAGKGVCFDPQVHSGYGVGEFSRPSLYATQPWAELWGGLPASLGPRWHGRAGKLDPSGENPMATFAVPQLPGSPLTKGSSPLGTHPAASSRMWTKGELRTWKKMGWPGLRPWLL